MSEPLVSVRNLRQYFKVKGGTLKAVDNISFDVYKGETFGLVGESGCGKTTTGRVLARLYRPSFGEVRYRGKDIADLSHRAAQDYAFHVQMIFQDPYASLDPRMPAADIFKVGMRIHHMGSEQEMNARMLELLELVGLNREHAQRFPYEFSGGQRQRIGIARALAVNPEFIICDEPISALDVSIQAQIINLLKRLQKELDLTLLFIAHDLSMVRYISDRVGVMYLGTLVETGPAEEVYNHPCHPYTQALLSAIPEPDPDRKNMKVPLEGDVPSPINTPEGCKFASHCASATEACRRAQPELQDIGDNHFVACARLAELMEGGGL